MIGCLLEISQFPTTVKNHVTGFLVPHPVKKYTF